MGTQSQLPEYDPLQRAFHKAFDQELEAIVNDLEMAADALVLDIPCGDGFFTSHLAKRIRGGGRIVGIDHNEEYLAQARKRTENQAVNFQQGDVYNLPWQDHSFDQALCAMSFISIEDPVRALREIRRVLIPTGGVAVLESDEYHHLLLMWPVDVEVAIQRAIRDSCGGKYSPARKVNRMLREAGFAAPRRTTYAVDRQAPFSDAVVNFLRLYLAYLRRLVSPYLSAAELARFDCCANPGENESLFHRQDSELTCLLILHQARR